MKGYTVTEPLYTSFKHAGRDNCTGVVNSMSLLFLLSSEFGFALAVVVLFCFHQIKE
jgi:hypothetical protein